MTHLSVNINKVATIRNARGGSVPNVVQIGADCQRFGADGITVHPRPDERHITYKDVRELRPVVYKEFNIEGFPNESFINLVNEVKPEQVTLVPDPPDVLTSNAGWNVKENESFLKEVISRFHENGIRVSLFMETDDEQIQAAASSGTDRIELYTEDFAKQFPQDPERAVLKFRKASELASELGLGLNAGHDLDLKNLRFFSQNVKDLLEVSIGHALISDALYFGLENTINLYKRELR